MVAIVSGMGLGLETGSAARLGKAGTLGAAGVGSGGQTLYMNAANGNLIVRRRDEYLAGLGIDIGVVGTYNSRGTVDGDNQDNWATGLYYTIKNLVGARNTAGSTIVRVCGDGSEALYQYDVDSGTYRSADGEGADQTLTYNASTNSWTWQDGGAERSETYTWNDAISLGRRSSASDRDGNTVGYAYNGAGLLTQISTADDETVIFDYVGNLLMSVCTADSRGTSVTRTTYTYDSQNRLSAVKTDLGEGGTTAGTMTHLYYTVSYTYDGKSNRLATIHEADGTSLAFTYTEVDGAYRLQTVTDTVLNRTTSYEYDLDKNETIVTDALGGQTRVCYDSSGRIAQVQMPEVNGISQIQSYGYDEHGRVESMIDAMGNVTTYGHDEHGNLTWQQDEYGNRVEWTYNAEHRVVAEKTLAAGDPNSGRTEHRVYDDEGHLRFVVSPAGRVTQYQYTAEGLKCREVHYADARYLVAAETTPSEAEMLEWAALRDNTQSELIEYTHDFRGQLSAARHFSSTLADGTGDSLKTVSSSNYVYDQYGRLLSRVDSKGAGTLFAYDGLDRLVASTTDGKVTAHVYSDTYHTTTITTAEGVRNVTQFNAAGDIISAVAGNLPATTYAYDKLGRLRKQTDPTGVATLFLYNAAGFKIAEINGSDRQFTEFGYNSDGQLTKTVAYANALTQQQMDWLTGTGAGGTALAPLFDNIADLTPYRPSASVLDRTSWSFFDAKGRLSKSVDALGGMTEFQYDGKDQLLATIRYDQRFGAPALAALTVATRAETLSRPFTTACLVERRIVDADGKLLATIDAENYLTENVYDAAGRVIESVRYANHAVVDDANPFLRPSLEGSRPAGSTDDQHSYNWYDDRGLLTANIDAEGYLTRYEYDHNDRLAASVRYTNIATVDASGTPQVISAPTDQTTSYTYNTRGLRESQTDPNGLVTRFDYDDDGRLETQTRGYGESAARVLHKYYDTVGRLAQTVDGEGLGVTNQYDAANRLTSSTDAFGNRTLYYYDAHSRLTHTINALGEVQQNDYDRFGQLSKTIHYTATLNPTTVLPALAGGLVNSTLQQAIAGIFNSQVDSTTLRGYDRLGQLVSQADANGNLTSFGYDTLGNVTSSDRAVGDGRVLYMTYQYDRLHHQVQVNTDPAGVNAGEHIVYDAFGRVTSREDAVHGVTHTTYDHLGRTISILDPNNKLRSSTYDAFSRLYSQTDALGRVTSYSYLPDARSMTVTSPEGTHVTQVTNKFGEQYMLVDANGNTTTYDYDRAGRVTRCTLPTSGESAWVSTEYQGQTMTTTDASGVVTRHYFDAANREYCVTVDPAGLGLLKVYSFDGQGRRISATDQEGVQTLTAYDKNGNISSIVVDPSGVNQRTTFTYDAQGHTLSLVEGTGSAARTTTYQYDVMGRRTRETVDPSGLQLVTAYTYDAAGRMVGKTDPEGNISRFAYDKDGRLVLSVDPTGIATTHEYDANGREIRVTVHLQPLSGLPTPAAMAASDDWARDLVIATGAADRTRRFIRDRDGRVIYTIEPDRHVTGFSLDPNGKATVVRRYVDVNWSLGTNNDLTIAESAQDHVTGTVFDSGGRPIYSVNELGQVTATSYDKAGRETGQVHYATAISWPRAAALLASDLAGLSLDNARRTATQYDSAGRRQSRVDTLGYVTSFAYDKVGRVTASTAHAGRVSWDSAVPVATQVATIIGTVNAADRRETDIFDKAGRVAYHIAANGEVRANVYDAGGLLVRSTQYESRYSGALNKLALDTYYNPAAGAPNRHVSANDRTTRTVRDAAGRPVYQIDALGNVAMTRYDGLGEVASQVSYAKRYTGTAFDAASLAAYYLDALNRSADDRQTAVVNDRLNRRKYSIDGAGRVRMDELTHFGQVERSTSLSTALTDWSADATAPDAHTLAGMCDAALDRTVYRAYDKAGKLVRQMGEDREVSDVVYDDFGKVVAEITYARKGAWTGTAIDVTADPVHDRRNCMVYDAAGEAVYAVDGLGQVTRSVYDEHGEVKYTIAFAQPYAGALNQAALDTYYDPAALPPNKHVSADDRQVAVVRDRVRGITYTIDGEGRVRAHHQNAFGQEDRTTELEHVLAGWGSRDLASNPVLLSEITDSGADRIVSRSVFDNAGRLLFTVNASGQATGYAYDGQGNVTTTTTYANRGSFAAASDGGNGTYTAPLEDAADLREAILQDLPNRKTYRIGKGGQVSVDHLNGFGQIESTVEAGTVIAGWASRGEAASYRPLTVAALQTLVASGARAADNRVVKQIVYDAAGSAVYQIDGVGQVSRTIYDEHRVVKCTIAYAEKYSGTADKAALDTYYDPAATGSARHVGPDDRQVAQIQDRAHSMTYTVDGEGRIRGQHRNTFGKVDRVVELEQVLAGWSARNLTASPLALSELTESGADRVISKTVFDNAGQAIFEVDERGHATGYAYDKQGKVTVTTAYANRGSFALTTDGSNGAYEPPLASAADQREALVQDLVNHKVYRVGADGQVSVETRNAFGQLEREVQAGTVVPGWADGNEGAEYRPLTAAALESLVSAGAHAAENRTVRRVVYGAAGEMLYQLDALGQVTRTAYDALGAVKYTIAYAEKYSGPLDQASLDAYFDPAATAPNRHVGDADRQEAQLLDRVRGITFTIDGEGRVYARHRNAFDQVDRVVQLEQVLAGWNSRNLASNPLSLSELTESSADHIISRIVFNHAGQAIFEVDALGHTKGFVYDSLNKVVATTTYANGGSFAAAADGGNGTYTAPLDDAADLREVLVRDLANRKDYRIGKAGQVTVEFHNAFGQVERIVQAGTQIAGWTKRGEAAGYRPLTAAALEMLVSSGEHAADNRTVSQVVYSAGGQAVYQLDGMGQVTRTAYDQHGAVKYTIAYAEPYSGAVDQASLDSFYDSAATGSDRHLSADDRKVAQLQDRDHGTTYTVDGEGHIQVQHKNAFGQVDRVTQLEHVLAGWSTRNLETEPLTLGEMSAGSGDRIVSRTVFDNAGQAIFQVDALGQVKGMTYDRQGKVAQTTTFASSGSFAAATDGGNGVFTAPVADVADQREALVVDPVNHKRYRVGKGGQVTVEWQDQFGRTRLAVQAATVVEGWTGRAESSAYRPLTPAALEALVSAGTHAGDNRVAQRTLYDADGNATMQVDGAGTVTVSQFDSLGRLVRTTTYAQPIRDWNVAAAEAFDGVLPSYVTAASANNRSRSYVYDGRDRPAYTVDQIGNTEQYIYNAFGDLSGKVSFAKAFAGEVSQAALDSYFAPGGANVSNADRYSVTRYDANGRASMKVDAQGVVTTSMYNSFNQVIGTLSYATAISPWPASPPSAAVLQTLLASVTSNAADRYAAYVYDDNGVKTQQVDGAGYVTEFRSDALGNVTSSTRYASTLQGWPNAALSKSALAAKLATLVVDDLHDRTTTSIHDADGQVRYTIDAEAYVTRFDFNAFGEQTASVRYPARLAAARTAVAKPADMQAHLSQLSQGGDTLTTAVAIDRATRTTYVTAPDGTVTASTYNVFGQVESITEAYGSDEATTTLRRFDRAGRLLEETSAWGRPEAAVTRYVYDGTTVSVITPSGVALAESNGNWARRERAALGAQYDVLDVASLTPAQKNSLLARYTSSKVLDGNGRVVRTTDVNGAVTNFQFDAFGNMVKVTDARNGISYFYYNARGEQVMSVNAVGEVVQNAYDSFGNIRQTIHFGNRVQGPLTVGAMPVVLSGTDVADPAKASVRAVVINRPDLLNVFAARTVNAVATFTYDALDRQRTALQVTTSGLAGYNPAYGSNLGSDNGQVTDRYQQREFDAFGDTVSTADWYADSGAGAGAYHNASNEYDRLGHLTREWQPLRTPAGTEIQVARAYTYDAHGNRTSVVEAEGTSEQRLTSFTFDLAGRVATKSGQATQVFDAVAGWHSIVPVEAFTYDRHGNLRTHTDAGGGVTTAFYDGANRKVAQMDAQGALTVWMLDPSGRAYQSRMYGAPVAAPAGQTVTLPSNTSAVAATGNRYDTGAARVTDVRVDQAGRVIESSIHNLLLGEFNRTLSSDAAYLAYTGDVKERYTYDASGNMVKHVDALGNVTRNYYDGAGRLVLTVDGAGYVTAFDRTANSERQTRYGGVPLQVADSEDVASVRGRAYFAAFGSNPPLTGNEPWAPPGGATANQVHISTNDYDGSGSLLRTSTELVGEGSAVVTQYVYNGMGKLALKIDGDGVKTSYRYDAEGRVVEQSQALDVIDSNGVNIGHQATGAGVAAQKTDTVYNAAGRVTQTIKRGAVAAADRVSQQRYDAAGNMVDVSDAQGYSWTTSGYDSTGHQTFVAQVLTDSDGNQTANVTVITYDVAGRELTRTTFSKAGAVIMQDGIPKVDVAQWGAPGWIAGTTHENQYDRFGQLVARGVHAYGATSYQLQEFFCYDNAGRLWKTNSGDGVVKITVRDAAGNATLTLRASSAGNGANMRELSLAQIAALDAGALSGMTLTITVFDARGHAVETIIPRDSVAGIMGRIASHLGAVQNSGMDMTMRVEPAPAVPGAPQGSVAHQALQVKIDTQLVFAGPGSVPSSALALSYSGVFTDSDLLADELPQPHAVTGALALRSITVGLPAFPGMENSSYRVVYTDAIGSLQTDVAGNATQAVIALPAGSAGESRLAAAGGMYTVTVYKCCPSGAQIEVATKTASLMDNSDPGHLCPWLAQNMRTVTYTRTVHDDEVTFTTTVVPEDAKRIVTNTTTDKVLLQLSQLPPSATSVVFNWRPLGSVESYLQLEASRISADGSAWVVNYSNLTAGDYEYTYGAYAGGQQLGTGAGRLHIEGSTTTVSPNTTVFSSEPQANVVATGAVFGSGYAAGNISYRFNSTSHTTSIELNSVVVPLERFRGLDAYDTASTDQYELLVKDYDGHVLYVGNAGAGAGEIKVDVNAELAWSAQYKLELYRRKHDDVGGRILLGQTWFTSATPISPYPDTATMAISGASPKVLVAAQPPNTRAVKFGYRARTGAASWQFVDLAQPTQAGTYELGVAGLGRQTDYDFEYWALDENGTTLNHGGGVFSVNNADQVSVTGQARGVGGIGSAVMRNATTLSFVDVGRGSGSADPNARPSGTRATLKYRASGASTWSAPIELTHDSALPNAFTWATWVLYPWGTYDYAVTVVDDAGATVNQMAGRIDSAVGSSSLLSYGRLQDVPGTVKISGVPAGTAAVTVDFASGGVTRQISATASSSEPGLFFWDPADYGLSGANGNYAVTAFDGNGAQLGQYQGAINLAQGVQTVHAARTGATMPAGAPADVAAWNWQLGGLDHGALSVHRTQIFDAFGQQASTTDALGNTTQLRYDGAGRVVARMSPQTLIENRDGSTTAFTPTTRYIYSAGGRVIRTVDVLDANHPDDESKNIVTRYSYLSASNERSGDPLVAEEVHADGGSIVRRFDAFGEVLLQQDSLQQMLGTGTQNEYDKNGNLVHVTHASGVRTWVGAAYNPIHLIADEDSYTYDAAGNRTSHTLHSTHLNDAGAGAFDINGVYTNTGGGTAYTVTDKTRYDAQNRIVATISAENKVTRYSYTYAASIKGLNDQEVGGVQLTVTEEGSMAHASAVTQNDYFGHTSYTKDLGGAETWFHFDQVQLTSAVKQMPGMSAVKSYQYYANGALKALTDGGIDQAEHYGYDANGARTAISLSSADGRHHYNETLIRYDANGRQSEVLDRRADVKYSYDQVGNVRHMLASYSQLTAQSAGQNYWYRYDKMGRQTVAMGTWAIDTDNQYRIVAGDTGVTVSYDANGNRSTVVYGANAQANRMKGVTQSESYYYDADGNNTKVSYAWGEQAAQSFHMRHADLGINVEVRFVSATNQVAALTVTSRTDYNKEMAVVARDTLATEGGSALVKHTHDDYHMTNGLIGYEEHLEESLQNGTVVEDSTLSTATYFAYDKWSDHALQTSYATWTSDANSETPQLQESGTLEYDTNGHLVQQVSRKPAGTGGSERVAVYMVNAAGQTLQSDEFFTPHTVSASSTVTHFHNQYVVNDAKTVGYISNKGAEVSNYTAPDTETPGQPQQLSTAWADFDQNFMPGSQAGSSNAGGGAVSYTVRAGDSLQSIAQSVWGDGSLWYLIADANGLNDGTTLQIGQVLNLPNSAVSSRHTDATMRPASVSLVNSHLSLAAPAGIGAGCGTTQLVVIAALAVAATVVTGGVAAMAAGAILGVGATSLAAVVIGGAVGAAAGDAVGQGLRIATGLQNEFNWGEVGAAAVMGGISAGIGSIAGSALNGAEPIVAYLSKVAIAGGEDLVRQGVDNLFGVRHGFDGVELGLSMGAALIPGDSSLGPRTFANIATWGPSAALKGFGVNMVSGIVRDAFAQRPIDIGRLAAESAQQTAIGLWSSGWDAEVDALNERNGDAGEADAIFARIADIDLSMREAGEIATAVGMDRDDWAQHHGASLDGTDDLLPAATVSGGGYFRAILDQAAAAIERGATNPGQKSVLSGGGGATEFEDRSSIVPANISNEVKIVDDYIKNGMDARNAERGSITVKAVDPSTIEINIRQRYATGGFAWSYDERQMVFKPELGLNDAQLKVFEDDVKRNLAGEFKSADGKQKIIVKVQLERVSSYKDASMAVLKEPDLNARRGISEAEVGSKTIYMNAAHLDGKHDGYSAHEFGHAIIGWHHSANKTDSIMSYSDRSVAVHKINGTGYSDWMRFIEAKRARFKGLSEK